jgi:hypothetical protein
LSARPIFLRHGNGGATVDTTRGDAFYAGAQHEQWLSDAELAARLPSRIPTRRPLLVRWWRAALRLWVRWQISATEQYLDDCERDGITDSLSIRDFHRQLDAMRVRLALLENS